MKIRASYIRESVNEGRLTIRHTPGDLQLADLATKLQPKVRLWRLLSLWGFVGDRLTEMLNAFKTKLLSVVVALSVLLVPVTGTSAEKKEPLAATGWEELAFLLVLTCVAVIGVWEAGKAGYRALQRSLKGSRRAQKMRRVSDLAAAAAKREVASQAGMSLVSEGSSSLRPASVAASSSTPQLRRRRVESRSASPLARGSLQDVAAQRDITPPRRRVPAEEDVSPSPGAQSSVSGGLEDLQERSRVVKDVLKLLSCEELKAALRSQGYLTSGLKEDLIVRLAPVFDPSSERSNLPTLRQLKFVLWLWREKGLQRRCHLRWTDVFTKISTSQFLHLWKDAPKV